jgi:hypothetical protein
MAKWDIDRELLRVEPESCPGTTIQRVMLDVKFLTNANAKTRAQFGGGRIKPTAEELERGWIRAWCLAVGAEHLPKAFFYDRTIRGAYLQARKALKKSARNDLTLEGRQDFTPSPKKAKKLDRRRSRLRTGSPEKRPDSP